MSTKQRTLNQKYVRETPRTKVKHGEISNN